MKCWVIKKSGEKEDLDKLIAGEINWRIKKERLKKGFRNPKNIGFLETGHKFIIYYVEKNIGLFCAEGTFFSKRLINSAYELTFHNRAGGKGFDEFPKKVDYNNLRDKISWRPIESSIHPLQEEDYRIIMSGSGLRYLTVGQNAEEKKEDDKGEESRYSSILSIETIAESSSHAMNQAMKYEQMHGRKPLDVSDKTVGFDIESKNRNGKVIRYIEVKSRKSKIPVALTDNEFKAANRFGEKYFLYVVTNDSIYIVKNPTGICSSEKRFITLWHLTDWLKKARKESINN